MKSLFQRLRGGGTTESIVDYEALANLLNERMINRSGGSNQRLAIMLGMLTNNKKHPIQANIPEQDRSMYSMENYKYLLFAPFKISNKCCDEMKKNPANRYSKETNRVPFTGQMACESRVRRQKWIQHGCNMFDVKHPKSNPMSFWTEQDVLKYIHDNGIEIAKPYGEVVVKNDTGIDGQTCIADLLGDYRDVQYETTKAKRTGCIFCMFGITFDKERFARLAEEEPKLYDYVMRGGEWNGENWQPSNDGLGYWFVIRWLNKAGKIGIIAPNIEKYEEIYGDERTREELQNGSAADENDFAVDSGGME